MSLPSFANHNLKGSAFLLGINSISLKYTYGFSFVHVYRKMHNFNNPNELPKEMLYFTYDEFQKFLSVEKDIKFRCAWQLVYYCGLRIGELKGITWKNIDFENRTVSINKQITQQSCRSKWTFSPTKTAKSNRVLPLTKVLLNDLEMLKKVILNCYLVLMIHTLLLEILHHK